MCVVGNAQLVWDRDQQSVRFRDRLVFPQLFYQHTGFSSIASAEDRPCGFVKEADRVLFLNRTSNRF
jgi:hypothetical protein